MCKESMLTGFGCGNLFNHPALIETMAEFIHFLLFIALQIAVVVYRRPLSALALGYLAAFLALYGVHFFWASTASLVWWVYAAIGLWIIVKEKRWLILPFYLCSLFVCAVVIPHVGGWGQLSPSMFFESEYNEAFVLLGEVDGVSYVFLLWVVLPLSMGIGITQLAKCKNNKKAGGLDV